MIKIAVKLTDQIKCLDPVIKVSNTGSVYVKLSNCKIKQVRISNHPGRKTGVNSWELRSDAVTGRYKSGRIYNVNAINQLASDLLSKSM